MTLLISFINCVFGWIPSDFYCGMSSENTEIVYFRLKLYFNLSFEIYVTSLVDQTVKCLPTIWETWVRFLGPEYPLEKEMATHSSIHAWKIPGTKEAGGLQSMGLQRVGHK